MLLLNPFVLGAGGGGGGGSPPSPEQFAADLTGYTVVNGVITPFSATGGVATIASRTAAEDTIKRIWGSTIDVRQYVTEFKATSIAADDSGRALVASVDSGGDSISVIPAREAGVDAAQRPLVGWATSFVLVGVRAVTTGKWYRAKLQLISGDVRYEIVNLDDATLFCQGTAGFSVSTVACNAFYLAADSPGPTGATQIRYIGVDNAVPTAPSFSAWNSGDKDADVSLNYLDALAAITQPGAGSIRGTQGRSAGKRYFEIGHDSSGGSTTDGRVLAGIGKSTASLATSPGLHADSWGYYGLGGEVYNNSSVLATVATWTTETTGILYDADASEIKFFKKTGAGTMTLQHTVSGVSGTLYPMWGTTTGVAGGRWGTINTGGWDFVQLPAGASAWG